MAGSRFMLNEEVSALHQKTGEDSNVCATCLYDVFIIFFVISALTEVSLSVSCWYHLLSTHNVLGIVIPALLTFSLIWMATQPGSMLMLSPVF